MATKKKSKCFVIKTYLNPKIIDNNNCVSIISEITQFLINQINLGINDQYPLYEIILYTLTR